MKLQQLPRTERSQRPAITCDKQKNKRRVSAQYQDTGNNSPRKQQTYNQEFLKITAMSNLPQGSEAPVDLISQCESNVNGRILWDFHLRNVWWRPDIQQYHKSSHVKISSRHEN